jgi:trimeric autotransporter adhesin
MTILSGSSLSETLVGAKLSDLIAGLAGNDTLTGNAGADTLDGGAGTDSLVGGTGNDAYVIDNLGDKIGEFGNDADDRILAAISIDLTANAAAFAAVEHVTLTGTSALNATGNGSANMLVGNSGANHLDGKAGADTLIGGAGNDVYEVDAGSDKVIELANGGIDQVNSSVDLTLGDNIENLTLIGTNSVSVVGNALANKMTANAAGDDLAGRDGNDTLIGNIGDDILNGQAGADSMVGGAGNDIYLVTEVGDKVMESGPSTDTADQVKSIITYTLGANIENLALVGNRAIDGTGNSLGNSIVGNSNDNILSGLGGGDILSGGQGFDGSDVLLGGDGNDTLVAGNDFDRDTLVGGAGSDVFKFESPDGLNTIADFNGLPGGDTLDVTGVLIDFFGQSNVNDFLRTSTINGSTVIQLDANGAVGGAAFADLAILQGLSTDLAGLLANGTIFGVGGTPVAPLDGTSGADSKVGGAGSDLIRGLAGNDTLTGNAGSDTLDGGAGTDSLVGGAGNDSYVIDSAGDKVSETGGDSDDRILASISIDLTASAVAYAGIEHVTLTGTSALNATGDGARNMLIGNSGANHLDGRAGADTLIGGDGNDVYEVDSFTDQVIELAGGGIDQVNSSVSFSLGGSANVENLTLTGTGEIVGTGNELANKITGNLADNTLAGSGGNDTLIGNDGDDRLDGGQGADSMVGGAGNDTYEVNDAGDKVVESGPSTDTADTVRSTIAYTLGANIENLTLFGLGNGTGNSLNNTIIGSSFDNVLSGLAGDDILNGGLGNDLLLGGGGNDTLVAAQGSDTLVGGVGGNDFLFFNSSLDGLDTILDLDACPGGDKIEVADLLTGFLPGVSNLDSFLKTSTVNGSTVIQVDADGTANGVAFVDLVSLLGVSTDLKGLLVTGTLADVGGATVELVGSSAGDNRAGGANSDLIRGLAGDDTLTGNAGADTLDGGAGKDSLVGGTGNDTYVIDSIGDKISETGLDANDRILASISIDLTANVAAFAGIEHVTLTDTSALNATGTGLGNMLIGNSGANILDGATGDDTLVGGAGDDTYKVDSAGDVVIELPDKGTDTVLSTASSFTLGANIENLTLTGGGIFAVTTGIGNDLANKVTGDAFRNALQGADGNDTLTGNGGNDTLDGGTGADSMAGGSGNDTYVVDNIGDIVTESGPSTDIDTVESAITFTIGATIERLRLTGNEAIDATGNALDNILNGNAGDNVLSGLGGNDSLFGGVGNNLLLGGDGNDLLNADGTATLVGGAGSDTFEFLSISGLDVIADFTGGPGGDVLDLDVLLSAFDFGSDNINDFLKTSAANGNTTIQVDTDGTANGVNFVDAVILQGVSTDIAGLLTGGNLEV